MLEIWGSHGPFNPLATPMFHKALDDQKAKFGQKKLTLNKT